tara:strand:- start:97 stop:636 length:540 start_codon:yes stop_codon:yes gene_type:complete
MYILTQNDLLLEKLLEFYNKDNNFDKMLNIITGNSKISLRIIDWFVTNYAKKYFTIYNVNDVRIKVFESYKLMLKAYSKKRFDPFCRWKRISIPYNETQYIQTTIGQLNFFKWAIQNKIIEYIEKNLYVIEKDMNLCNNSRSKQNKKDLQTTRKKREELSVSACRSIKREYVDIEIDFK